MFDIWKSIFSTSSNKAMLGGKPSADQCRAARSVFGDSVQAVNQACTTKQDDTKALAKQIHNQLTTTGPIADTLSSLWQVINGLQDDIQDFKDWIPVHESERKEAEFEKSFFTSRIGTTLYGNESQVSITPKAKSIKSDSGNWIDDAIHTLGKNKVAKPASKNYYSKHDLRPGRVRF